MQYGDLYFYTSTIHKWRPVIHQYDFYSIILEALSFLHRKNCLRVYGFVIMPNHMHLIWQLLQPNGKESPVASLMKYTAHRFEQHIRWVNPADMINYQVDWKTRKFNFWQTEPDWFLLWKEKTTLQKLNYIHNNPLQERWQLAEVPEQYRYSSAAFYETGVLNYDFLYHYKDFNDRID
jgi:putative transposase